LWLAFVAGFTSLLTLPSAGLDSGFFTSGVVLPFGEVTGLPEGEVLGLATGVVAGVELTTGLFSGVFAFGSQAPKIAVEAARTVANAIDLLIDLSLFTGRIRGSFRGPQPIKPPPHIKQKQPDY
jgi:hypothetical protein